MIDVTTWTLRRRVAALCIAVGAVLVLLGLLAAVAAGSNSGHLDTILNKTGPMRAAGESLNTALVDQETGVRGFALGGKDADLAPYQRGIAEEDRLLDEIAELAEERDADILADVADIRARAQTWRSTVAEPVITAVRGSGPDAGQALITDDARVQFGGLRAAVTDLQDDIWTIRQKAAADARRTGGVLVAVQIGAAMIIVVASIMLLSLLNRLVTRPVLDLAAQVREVAGGDYERRITSTSGSPEMVRLADDIDAMRRQIAAELSQVREARGQVEWVNDQLKIQAEELTRSNRDLEQFAYVASHDLQEPLRKVASFCQLLQRRYQGQMDERADQYIAFAVDGAQRMQRLINDLLAFSRIGRLTAGFVDVDLDRVLTEVKSQLETRAGEDAEITWADLPVVEGEEALLTTLFVNLVGNSLKFRRPDVAPRIVISAERDGKEWQIRVQDNGIGIEPEFADKVFVIFQRLHARDAYEGTGIGLAIVKKIVEYHGGRIWLDPDVAEGTAIIFTLPVSMTADAEPVAGEPMKEVAA